VAIELEPGDASLGKVERLDMPKRPSRAPLRRTV